MLLILVGYPVCLELRTADTGNMTCFFGVVRKSTAWYSGYWILGYASTYYWIVQSPLISSHWILGMPVGTTG